MKFSFLGYSVKRMMEFSLDVKDIVILRYFDDFRKTGKMNYEEVHGEKYYWVSYQNIERELPFLDLNRRSIMKKMHKLRDAGILKHYTRREGGTFSYYAVDKNYEKLLYSSRVDCNLTDDIDDDFNYRKVEGKRNIDNEFKCAFIYNNEEDLRTEGSNLNNNYKKDIEVELSFGIDVEKKENKHNKENNEGFKDNYSEKEVELEEDLESDNEKGDGYKRTLDNDNYRCNENNRGSKTNKEIKIYKNKEENLKNKVEFQKSSINFNGSSKENLREDIVNLSSSSKINLREELALESHRESRILKGEDEIIDRKDEIWHRGIQNKGERLYENMDRGCLQKGRTKIHLLNNPSTKVPNLIKDIEKEIIDYLNLRAGVIYRDNNSKTLSLIRDRLSEGFNLEDFKRVIDKKVEEWKGSSFERHLTPFTLFGDKFEIYLNQKIREEDGFDKNRGFVKEPRKLRFDNFEPRKYDYDDLEKKLLGWG